MIYWLALLIWIISVLTLIIFLKYNFDDKYLLIVSQIYNFMTGFLGGTIYFLSIMFIIKYLSNITNMLHTFYNTIIVTIITIKF